jgi:putative addiction module component (TIGR02574 family)
MTTSVEALEAEVLKLSPDDRSRLLERLALSLSSADAEVEEAWDREADRREAQLADGTVQLVSGDEAIARLRAKLG